MSLWEQQRGLLRGLQQRGNFDRQDWMIYAAVVALGLVTAATYLLPR